MELNATISIGLNGKLEYSAVHSAGSMSNESLNRLEALTIAHKAIEEAIAKANDTLEENGLTAQLADPRFDKYGNQTTGYYRHWSCRRIDQQQEQSQNHNTKLTQKDETGS